jgi:hypothetical protein
VAVHGPLGGEQECALFWSSVFLWARERADGRSVLFAMDANAVLEPSLDRTGDEHRQDPPFQAAVEYYGLKDAFRSRDRRAGVYSHWSPQRGVFSASRIDAFLYDPV